jgi:hypothetical protein
MKKRILVLLSVVALMVVMMVVTVAPAFAAPPAFHPTPNGNTPNHTSSCAQDPTCHGEDVGVHHFESFPPGQDKFPPDTPDT